MPIWLAISGIEIPGCASTSASACAARLPEPFGRPGLPEPLRRGFALPRERLVFEELLRAAGEPMPSSASSAA